MSKDKTITELLHGLTQERRTVTFSYDFSGMITIAIDGTHEHLSYPHGTLKELETSIVQYLAGALYNDDSDNRANETR